LLRFVFDLQCEPSTRITTKLLVEEGPGENVVGNAAKFRVRVWKMDKGGKSGPQGQFVLFRNEQFGRTKRGLNDHGKKPAQIKDYNSNDPVLCWID
jgi:hypothetical protein